MVRKVKQTKFEEEFTMWVNENFGGAYYKVSREERQEYNFKLEEVFKSYGKYIEVIDQNPSFFGTQEDIAYMEHNHLTGEFYLKCGRFWFQEENLCPVVAMTHELGHFIDATQNFNGDMRDYNKTLGTLELEVRAWEFGIKVCMDIGLGKYKQMIFDYAEKCLGTYFNSWNLPNDRMFGFTGERPSFTQALNRIRTALGMEVQPERPERPQRPSLQDMWEELSRQMEAQRRVAEVQFKPLEELEMSPLERMKQKKIEARKNLKKSLGSKGWEL
jgi:hypothetical protein